MTSGQHIDYDALALEALRGVVRACLNQVARTGLVGDHHFYIAFNTLAPGVGMSKRLREKYPQEMTIVLQHRFWDLAVEEERFEVKLTFDGIPERLVVPFKAIKVFYDPSVPYGLQFEETEPSLTADAARRPHRRPVGFPRDGDTRGGVAKSDGLGIASQHADHDDDLIPTDREDRRRGPRRSRPEHQQVDQDLGDRQGADRLGAETRHPEAHPDDSQVDTPDTVEPTPAELRRLKRGPVPVDKVSSTPKQSVPQVSAHVSPKGSPKVSVKPAAMAAVGKGDEPPADTNAQSDGNPDGDGEGSGGGAKIFDLSKFRSKK